jgi:hypothetical protein
LARFFDFVDFEMLARGGNFSSRSISRSTSGHTMEQHKFKIGEHVSLRSGQRDMADGIGYEVTRLLPGTFPEPQYRIKRSIEIHERVAGEHLLRRVGSAR